MKINRLQEQLEKLSFVYEELSKGKILYIMNEERTRFEMITPKDTLIYGKLLNKICQIKATLKKNLKLYHSIKKLL